MTVSVRNVSGQNLVVPQPTALGGDGSTVLVVAGNTYGFPDAIGNSLLLQTSNWQPGGSATPVSLVVQPNGNSSITAKVSGQVSLFTDVGLSVPAVFPATITTNTTYYASVYGLQTLTVSLKDSLGYEHFLSGTAVLDPANPTTTISATAPLGSGTYRVTINVPAPTNVTATDWANISAALTKAAGIVATGGSPEIVFQACPYNSGTTTLTPYSIGSHTIPLYQGVTYRGVKPYLSNTADASSAEGPGGDFAFVGGTVLLGDGTAPAMAVNNVDAASPAVGWQTQVVSSVGVFGFGFDTFTYGIQAGAQNVLGVMMSQVDEVYARNCSQWGFEFKNPALSDFGVLMACLCQNGVHIAADMPSATYSPGNSTFKHLYVAIPQDGRDNRKCRGVYLEAHATSGTPDLNELDIRRVQVNSFNVTQLSVTATFTNTSANIAVPDGTLFTPGYWVQFATSQAGFSANRNYVVVSVSGNNLTLALDRSHTAIVASASSTATLKTSGFPSLDIGPTPGGSATSGWYVTNTVIGQADTEGTKVGMVLENLQGCLITQCNVPGTFPAVIGRRANTSILRLVGGGVVDFDGTTAATCLVFGTLGTELQQTPAGLWWDNVANLFRLSGGAAGNGTGLQIGVTAADKVGHFGSTPVVQPTRAGQLTDSSGGTSGGNTVAAVTDVASAANAVATLTARLNSLEAKLSAAGGGVGLTA